MERKREGVRRRWGQHTACGQFRVAHGSNNMCCLLSGMRKFLISRLIATKVPYTGGARRVHLVERMT